MSDSKHATRPYLSQPELLETHARHERDKAAERAADALRQVDKENRSATAGELANVSAALDAHDRWEARYASFKAQAAEQRTRLSIRHEPLTYEPPEREGTHSYFSDSWEARQSVGPAIARLERHAAEMRVEGPKLRERLEREQRSRTETLGVEYRANPSPISSTFAPPLYLVQDWANAPRPERVLSKQFTNFVLPKGVQQINLPRLTTGTTTGVATPVTPTPEQDIIDAQSSAQVITIAGQSDVSIQSLEQSPNNAHLDRILWSDLRSSYDATVESQTYVGGGGKYELNGVLNAGINAITTTETIAKLWPALAETFGSVSDTRKLSPTAFFTRGGFWAALATAQDLQNRPFYVPLDQQSNTTAQPIGVLIGLPVYLTESIPTNLGTGKNQQCVLAGRPEDSYFWESPPSLSLFDETLSATLQVRIVLRGYVAAIHRYPTSYASLTGFTVAANE
jgi:hypothetical protein